MLRKMPVQKVVQLIEADMLTKHMMNRQQVEDDSKEQHRFEVERSRRNRFAAWMVIGSMLTCVVLAATTHLLLVIFGR